jgi:hypothetical protein
MDWLLDSLSSTLPMSFAIWTTILGPLDVLKHPWIVHQSFIVKALHLKSYQKSIICYAR